MSKKTGRPLTVVVNPSIKQQREELRAIQTNLKNLKSYRDLKILSVKQNRSSTSSLKETIIDYIKLNNIVAKEVSVYGALKIYCDDNSLSVNDVMDEAIKNFIRKYKK